MSERFIQSSKSNPKLTCDTTDDGCSRVPGVSGQCQKKPYSSDKSSLSKKHLVEQRLSSRNFASSVNLNSQFDSAFSSSSEKHCTQQVLSPLDFSSVRYFIMKSSNLRNIEISQQKGIWSTIPGNETKLTKALQENEVILIFSVQGSGHFQGYARMSSTISYTNCQDWGFGRLGGVFSVEWICKENLPFQCTQHILNPLNDNKKVQISRDGQELDAQAGRLLLSLWFQTTEGTNCIC
ncbi:YTH domain-containing protein 2-like [Hippocampus comes]|uniref:YTH domain-containing protein 2-like n=1 Tax=Hippocampus comes TaxID=109280 RepID=UPI00094E5664|nr:PREDICTED: YTH domain-containing protein 2-like [Hippocampus comes]